MVADNNNMPEIFSRCNIKYFEGKLPFPQFELLHSYRTCGRFEYTHWSLFQWKTFRDPIIKISDYYDFTQQQYDEIMCHEIIHYYLAFTDIDRKCDHGKEFNKMAKELNRKYKMNISKCVDTSKYKKSKKAPYLSYWTSKMIGAI